MNRAGCYARYSSDLQNPLSNEDQTQGCRKYSDAQQFQFLGEHVYTDAAVSGTILDRPGLQALLKAAASKPRPFDIVLVDDTSRLSRDMKDVLTIHSILKFHGVRLIAISQGIDTQNEQADVLVAVHGIVDSLYVKELAAKTHRGLAGAVERGFSAGGRTFGYDNVPTSNGVRLRVNPAQAEIMERIFELRAARLAYKAIARKLSADGVPSPRPRKGRLASWCHTGIKAMLENELYIGIYWWNRTRFVRTPDGKRIAKPRPQSEWKRVDLSELRIISDDLWQEVRRVDAYQRERFGGGGKGNLYALGRGEHRLLSSFLKCGECGGNLSILTGAGKGRHARYGCGNHANRDTCSNDLREREDDIQQRLLSGLQQAVLTNEAVEYAINEFTRQLQTRLASMSSHLAADRKRKAALETELERLTDRVASGDDFSSLRRAIASREAELQEITDRLLSTGPASVEADLSGIRAFVTRSLSDLSSLLHQDVERARAWLAQHVREIMMTPSRDSEGKRYYVASGEWNLLGGKNGLRDSGYCGGWI